MNCLLRFHISALSLTLILLLLLFKSHSATGIDSEIITNRTKSLANSEQSVLSEISKNKTLCTVRKGEHIYDLSSLSQRNFWFHSERTHNDSTLLFLLSVCHPLQYVSACSGNTGVCFTYVNNSKFAIDPFDSGLSDVILSNFSGISFTSAGNIPDHSPEVQQEGYLKYVYENGGNCLKGNSKEKYKTEVHLHCPSSPEAESPGPTLLTSPKCLFLFVWNTFAACPKKIDVSADPCIISFSSSDYSLNLHSLHSQTFYKAKGINSSYELNICGPIQNGSCPDNTAVCDISDPASPKVIATSEKIDFDLQYATLTLTYKSSVQNFSTNIYLYCVRTAFIPRVYFTSINKKDNSYNFAIYTINVCIPQSSDCVLEDRRLNLFDLRPLHKKDNQGNWEVIGKNPDGHSVLFNLNVCGPINPSPNLKCPLGLVGACQPSVSVSGAKNIGYITSNPEVNNDGSITLMYTGGDSCKEGVRSSSTRILFVCSKINYPPIFVRVTASCVYLFEWQTPAACPVNVVSTRDCRVTDPLFGHNYDLNHLRNPSNDYQVTNGKQHFVINVCGPLLSKCGDHRDNTSVCQLGEEEISGGESPAELVFNDGTLTMKFSGGSPGCGDKNWMSQILFLCSHDEKGLDGLYYIHADDSACIHHFIWHTTRACPPHEVIDCSVRDGDLIYDLNPLSNPNMNEIVIIYRRMKYILNVCRSVIHSKESRCAYDAGACLIDLTHENKTLNLGKIDSGPYVENGVLKVKYDNGDVCNNTHTHTTIIEFECIDKQYSTYPMLLAAEDCVTLFKWSSIYACPQNASSETPEDQSIHNCTAQNPITGYVFDMNLLKAEKPYELVVRDGVTLLVSVCGNVSDSRCAEDEAGACVAMKNGKSSNAGKSNQALNFHMWTTHLEYEGGEQCSNGFERSTRISFICQDEDSGPIFISDDQDSCTYFVNWYTMEACERHIRCFAHSWDRTYDLSSLIRIWGNYEVKDPEDTSSTYLLNVCRPLNPVIGVNCHPGSSSCLVTKDKEPIGLGHPILNPNVASNDDVHLMYTHGSECPEGPKYYSSRIIFICNKTAGAGSPEFYRRMNECHVQFKWETSLVCPPSEEEGQCQITFEAAKTNIDLGVLKRPDPYQVNYKGETFLVSVCGAIGCRDNVSSICTKGDDRSYGLSTSSTLKWDRKYLVLVFDEGDQCHDSLSDTFSSRIFFECDPNAGFGTPQIDPLTEDLNCMAVFTWKTNLTCIDAYYHSDDHPTTLPPSPNNISSSTTQPPNNNNNTGPEFHIDDDDMSQHTWISVMTAALVLIGVVAASAYVLGRSAYGRRVYAQAKRTLSRTGYANAAENDTLLQGETAYVYRVDEDEQVLRV